MPFLRSLFKPPKVPQVSHESEKILTDTSRSPASFRNTSHKTGISIAAFDISPDRTHAVLAGRDILKTIQVSDYACAEDFNLRTNIIAYAATRETPRGATSAKHKDQLAANDVKWSHGNFSTTIATAVSNGQIVVYDISRPGVEIARLHEHTRQVHRLGFNPHQGHRLLSGSQDGTVRMWDLRDLARNKSVMTCQSLARYTCNRDGIRDVKWSPTNGVEFAVGTDDGSVQRWDITHNKAPSLIVKAHEKSCYSIDWHPDGRHLVSGGGDKNIMIWDFSSSNRKMKPSWNIRAPQAVLNVCWRPPCWSSGEQSLPGWQCTQLAASYDQQQPQIHIWDFRRPYIPFRILDRYSTPATALLWRSESLLWSIGSAGMFTQTDTNSAKKTIDHRSPNVLAIAPDGKILFFSQKREARRPSIEDALESLNQQDQRRSSISERLGGSHGTAQGSSEEPRLQGSSLKNRQRRYPRSTMSAKSLGGTPPSAGAGGPVLELEKSLDKKYIYRPSQVGGIGYVEGLFDAPAFRFLARHYKAPLPMPIDDNTECNLHLQFSEIFRENAALVERTSQYRLSQSWHMLALAVDTEFYARAEDNYQKRTKATATITATSPLLEPASLQSLNKRVDILTDLQNDLSLSERDAPQAKVVTSSALENASNMTTPLARPVPDSVVGPGFHTNIESLQLPDSTWSKQLPKPVVGVSGLSKMNSPESLRKDIADSHDNIEHTDFAVESEDKPPQTLRQRPSESGLVDIDRQMTERRAAMGNYRAMPRPLLKLDDPIQLTSSGLDVPSFGRHDSNESFQLFSASTDSSRHGQSMPGSFESNQNSEKSASTPERVLNADQKEGRDASDQDETALIFDDEEQLSSPRGVPFSASNVVLEELEDRTESTMTAKASLMLRPTDLQQPTIHYEDMEELGQSVQPVVAETATDVHKYILTDFLAPEHDPEYLHPWTATAMFETIIDFHQYKLKDAQLPAYLLLHLGPYIRHSIGYGRTLQILLFYHDQLVSLELYAQAAELRKICHKRYPAVAEKGLYDITPGGPWCTVCRKSNKGGDKTKPNFCDRCKESWAECPVCNGDGPISEERPLGPNKELNTTVTNAGAADKFWGWCQDCGHGGHNGCLRTWWEFGGSEGACPTVGCLCDCMPGTRRDEYMKAKKQEEDKKRKVVSKDDWAVGPSPAAQRTRRVMAGGPGGSTGAMAGRGATSLAGAGRSASGGKKVRIVVPEDEEEVGKEDGTPSSSAP